VFQNEGKINVLSFTSHVRFFINYFVHEDRCGHFGVERLKRSMADVAAPTGSCCPADSVVRCYTCSCSFHRAVRMGRLLLNAPRHTTEWMRECSQIVVLCPFKGIELPQVLLPCFRGCRVSVSISLAQISQWCSPVLFAYPGMLFLLTLCPQSCWCMIQVIHTVYNLHQK
jgi:hypothetical protein